MKVTPSNAGTAAASAALSPSRSPPAPSVAASAAASDAARCKLRRLRPARRTRLASMSTPCTDAVRKRTASVRGTRPSLQPMSRHRLPVNHSLRSASSRWSSAIAPTR